MNQLNIPVICLIVAVLALILGALWYAWFMT